MAERPVLAADFNQADEDIFGAQAGAFMQVRGDAAVERALLREAAPPAQGDLDEDHAVAAVDAEVLGALRPFITEMRTRGMA